MSNIFDSVQDGMFDIVTQTMGYPATWTPSTGGDQQNATVLLKQPTEKYTLEGQTNYEPYKFIMEYKSSVFTGLKANIDNKLFDVVNIAGIDYYVKKITAKYDGKTMVAILEPK